MHTDTTQAESKKIHIPKYNVIALTGPQGSGKTTQLALLLEKAEAEFASVGEILRGILPTSEKPEHQEARDMMYAGQLIPDEVTFDILMDYFSKKKEAGDTKAVLIFDGFPRTPLQADHLMKLAEAYHGTDTKVAVIRLNLDPESAHKRCTDRAEAVLKSGKTPRTDDTPDAIKARLGIYFGSIPSMNESFVKHGADLHEFDGSKSPETVHEEVIAGLFE